MPLGDEQTIKGIFMVERHGHRDVQMVGQNPQQLYGIPVDVLCHEVRKREREREPTPTPFMAISQRLAILSNRSLA